MKKVNKKVTLESVHHGQIIECGLWGHQIAIMFMNLRGAVLTATSLQLPEELVERMRIGEILVSTLNNTLTGIAKDHPDRFRMISFPVNTNPLN